MSDIFLGAAGTRPSLEGMDLQTLDNMQRALVGSRDTLDEMTEEELEFYIKLCAKIRLTGRIAAKPAANGGNRRGKKLPAPEVPLSDLLD